MHLPLAANQGFTPGQQQQGMPEPPYRGNPELEQAGIDFVLTYDNSYSKNPQ